MTVMHTLPDNGWKMFLWEHADDNIALDRNFYKNLGSIFTFRTDSDIALEDSNWDKSWLRWFLWNCESFFISLNLSHIRNWVDICNQKISTFVITFSICDNNKHHSTWICVFCHKVLLSFIKIYNKLLPRMTLFLIWYNIASSDTFSPRCVDPP
jgi:hypothetical protein